MMYLYRIQPARPEMLSDAPTPQETDIVSQHVVYLEDLTQRGIVLLAGRTQTTTPDSFGIIIFNVDSEEAAQQLVDNDPGVKNGVFRAELFPYKIAMVSEAINGFA